MLLALSKQSFCCYSEPGDRKQSQKTALHYMLQIHTDTHIQTNKHTIHTYKEKIKEKTQTNGDNYPDFDG